MKVILNDHIEHLGERGDSVAVKPGYANNYLIPKGLAYHDNAGNRRRFGQDQKRWEEMDVKRRGAAEKLAADLEGTKLAFERRAGENNVLFGSVNVADIARELAARGFEIDRKRVRLEHAIKELGAVDVVVHIHRDINVTVPVRVVRPGEDPNAAAPQFVAEGVLEVPDEIEDAGEAEVTDGAVTVDDLAAEVVDDLAAEVDESPETGPVTQ